MKSADLDVVIQHDQDIYEASPQRLYQIISAIPDTYESAMLVGHNPGMEGIIQFLTGQLEPMPTAALAVILLNVDNWSAVTAHCGELLSIHRPKDLRRDNAR